MNNNWFKGQRAEEEAKSYLITQGLKWIASNYRCRLGELDLIMQEKNCLVFIEVRARSSTRFGGAAASVIFSKQRKLIKTAYHYLLKTDKKFDQPIRFDVLSFEGNLLRINWIKNAFGFDVK